MAITIDLPNPCGPALAPTLCFQTIGGGQFCLPTLGRRAGAFDVILAGLRSFGIFFLPLIPLVAVLQALNALFNWIVDLPENLAALIALDPNPLKDDTAKVLAAFGTVVAIAVPVVAFIQMIRGFIAMLILYFSSLQNQLLLIVRAYARIGAQLTVAANLGNLKMTVDLICAQRRVDAKLATVLATMGPISILLGFINVVLCLCQQPPLIGLPPIPSELTEAIINAIFAPIIAALLIVLNALPNIGGVNFQC